MVCLYTKFHTAGSNSSLIVAIKTEAKRTYLVAAILNKVLGLFAKSRKASSCVCRYVVARFPLLGFSCNFILGNLKKKICPGKLKFVYPLI